MDPESSPQSYPTGIPLPALQPGLCVLDYLPSVLPAQDQPLDRFNRGWTYDLTRNQVEVLTMTVEEDCELLGIGFANPVKADEVAFVESVSLYKGRNARDNLIARHEGFEQIAGGGEVLSYIHFRTAFPLFAKTAMTLKVKLASQANPLVASLLLYRGNPFARPDVWRGRDLLVWTFEDTQEVGPGEVRRTINSGSGPILRLIYKLSYYKPTLE